jgi:hypothetical protein
LERLVRCLERFFTDTGQDRCRAHGLLENLPAIGSLGFFDDLGVTLLS